MSKLESGTKGAWLLLLYLVSFRNLGTAQETIAASVSTVHQYKAGEIWRTKAPKGSTVLILEVEPKGNLLHIRLNDVPVPCGKLHVTTSIEHLVVSEKSLKEITTKLAFENVTIPKSYFEPLQAWKQNHGKTYDRPLAKISLDQAVVDEICRAVKTGKSSKHEYTIYP